MSSVLDRAQRIAEMAQERVGLLERLEEIKQEFMALLNDEFGQTVSAPTTPRRGRPPGSGRKDMGNNTPRREERESEESHDSEWKDLPSLLTHIAEQQSRPLKLADFVQLARQAGYNSDAKDFPNMVYQSLLKLVKRGVLEKDQESRDYHYVGKVA